ncbi:phage tail tube protein [Comamonas thiooxydans]|uniref:phage tail tube protein n=1 Tax=Comamonas thiooxydans TaxID=363952 RepID=UPI000B4107D0|nr:phage tail tube protein [Comamonas thiooxydans]
MASLPSSSRMAVATGLSEPKAVSAITNAVEAVCNSPANGLVVGDIVVLTSGWSRLNERVCRVKAVTAPDSFTLEAFNTSNLNLFPAGAGVGAFQKVVTWVDLLKVLRNDASGGAAKKVTYRYLEDDNERELNDGFAAVARTIEIDADALETAGYKALALLTDTGADTVLRTTTKKGAVSYLYCTVAMNEEVLMQDGQVNRVSADVSGKSRSTRFAKSVAIA